MAIQRLFVRKRDAFANEAAHVLATLQQELHVPATAVQIYERYDVENLSEKAAIKQYYINPVDSREASLELPDTLALNLEEPKDVAIINGFTEMTEDDLQHMISEYGLAMTLADIQLIQNQYKNVEKRNPTITEIRLFDTYWSDHCRHTTFMTELTDITIEDSRFTEPIKEALEEYTEGRNLLYTTKLVLLWIWRP